jgi:predicted metal-dependent hydrolase
VQFEFILNPASRSSKDAFLGVSGRQIPLVLIRNPRARRYVLRLRPDGSARVTIPRCGSAVQARRFAERNKDWLEQQLHRLAARPSRTKEWLIGTEILFRGELVKVEVGVNKGHCTIRFGGEVVHVSDPAVDLRPAIESHLWRLGAKELPPRVLEYAELHQLPVRRITVRNQRTRWGSCSRRGTISLNWRLIQTPPFVQDYIVIHEVMHLREMNHSLRFWREVERAYPDYEAAERWLKQHSFLLK